MISPNEIQEKEFSKGVRGYKEEEVDMFLDQITLDLETLLKENSQLKEVNAQLMTKLDDYKSQEGAVVKTLEAAKSLMTDISASAEKRADILIKNAEIDAASMLKQAKDNLMNLQAEEAMLTERIAAVKKNFRAMLEAELAHFNGTFAGIETPVVEIKKPEGDPDAVKQFNDLINSVESQDSEKDFFDDKAFENLNDDLSKTIVSMRKDIE